VLFVEQLHEQFFDVRRLVLLLLLRQGGEEGDEPSSLSGARR
jgi:hypothetical protein